VTTINKVNTIVLLRYLYIKMTMMQHLLAVVHQLLLPLLIALTIILNNSKVQAQHNVIISEITSAQQSQYNTNNKPHTDLPFLSATLKTELSTVSKSYIKPIQITQLSNSISLFLKHIFNDQNVYDISILGVAIYEEDTIKALLKTASEEGMLLYSSDSKCYIFAHDRIRQASLEIATEKDQDGLVLHISQVLQDVASQRSEMEWCVYVAVDLLNSLPEKSIPLGDLVKLNMKVSRLAGSKGSVKRQNELLHKALMCLDSSGGAWKDYKHTLELYNAVIVSDHALGKTLILALAFLCFISQSHYSSIITKPQDLTIRQGSLLQRSLGMPSH